MFVVWKKVGIDLQCSLCPVSLLFLSASLREDRVTLLVWYVWGTATVAAPEDANGWNKEGELGGVEVSYWEPVIIFWYLFPTRNWIELIILISDVNIPKRRIHKVMIKSFFPCVLLRNRANWLCVTYQVLNPDSVQPLPYPHPTPFPDVLEPISIVWFSPGSGCSQQIPVKGFVCLRLIFCLFSYTIPSICWFLMYILCSLSLFDSNPKK